MWGVELSPAGLRLILSRVIGPLESPGLRPAALLPGIFLGIRSRARYISRRWTTRLSRYDSGGEDGAHEREACSCCDQAAPRSEWVLADTFGGNLSAWAFSRTVSADRRIRRAIELRGSAFDHRRFNSSSSSTDHFLWSKARGMVQTNAKRKRKFRQSKPM